MKLKLLLLLFFTNIYLLSAQTDCSLDETKFTGTFTTAEVGGTKIKASDATANHRFGERVAIDGNIAVTVSRANGTAAGKAYVFINDGSGNWIQQTILTASDGFVGDNFGSSVALEGNYLLVGARSQLDSNDVDTGAAYLFEYNGVNTWTEVAKFEPSDGTTGIRFGESVSIEGNLVLIGARDGCVGGCAYLYENDGTNTFTYSETKLEPQVQSNYSGARFGYAVLLKDGRAYVGGPQDYSVVGNASAGSVQIWDQENDGSWSRTHRLRGTESTEFFGCAISVQGDYLAIGALNFETSSTSEADQGRVYVYKADVNGNYSDATRVMIQNSDKDSYTDQRFGSAVALENEYVFVGARGVSGSINSDALYIFKGDGSNNWTEISKITTGDAVGYFSNNALSISYPNMIVGQSRDHFPSNSGAIHFVPLASTITPTASVTQVTEALIAQNNAAITLNFSDEATRTEIQFSIDGGTTFPYTFNDNALTGTITNLGVGSYELKARYNEGSCVLDLGTVTINQAAYTAIPDANFEAALEALGYDDITGDGQVPTSLIEVVTDLQLAGKNITDLTGIEDFVALEELKANGNDIATVDLSNNLALKLLFMTSNSVLSTIDFGNNTVLEDVRINYFGTAIDISGLTALDRFSCTNCGLTSLNTSGNTNLNWLDVAGSAITSLDLNTNLNLSILEIDNTDLEKIDVSNNALLQFFYAKNITSLTSLNIQNGANTNLNVFETSGTPVSCILVDDAAYSTSNWTIVDPASSFNNEYCDYTTIPDTNFEATLEALGYDDISSDGQVPTALIEVVTTLDVANKNIANLSGIEDFKALQVLECQSNNLTALNISANTALMELTANANDITNIDISKNTLLETLIIGANDLTSIDISNNTLLKRLDILYNDITALDTSNNPDLETLIAYNTDVVSYDFSNNPLLRNVQLYNNNSLTTLDVSNLTQLDQLRLDNTGIADLDVSNNLNLRIIRVNQSNINKLDLSNQSSLIHVYVDNSPINFLNVQNGNNTSFAQFHADKTPNLNCVLVDDASYSTTNWTNIDGTMSFSDTYCNYTAIPDANFEAALYALGYDDIANDGQVPTALVAPITTLDLINQNIADLTGIQDFAALTYLNLDTNALTSLDLSSNTNLQTLNFDNNSIANLNLGAISNLTSIEGRYNQLTTIDLSQNSNLTFINLRDNLFTTIDVSNNPLLETINLRGCTNLTSIDISGNPNVKFLYFQDTALTGLDVSQNLLLEVIVIERVNFNTIDVSKLSNLKQLRIADNSFTHLDVSNNPALVRLECENNDLTYLNLKNGNNINMPNTDFKVTGNPSLSCIIVDDATWSATNWTNIDGTSTFTNTFCHYTAIPDANFEAALEALGYDDISGDGQVPTPLIEVLSSLDVDGKSINDLTGIEDFVALTYLNCNGNNLTTIDITQNIHLAYFNAAQNNLTTVDLSKNVLLESLYLFSNDLTTIDLSNNTALKQLYIQRNTNLPTFDISSNTLIEEIDCSETNITTLNTTNNTLLRNLEANDSPLSSLDLSTNTALELLRLFTTNITVLDLTNNTNLTELRINDTGIQSLDLRNQVGLITMNAKDANLSYLNMQNGNNTNVASYLFNVTNNPNLSCVLVDNTAWSTTNWTLVDATTSFSDTYCRYTTIPDANFEAALGALNYDDISGDGQVPTALIETVEDLTIVAKSIADITGIESFTALKTLNCASNSFKSLDLSNNTELTSVITKFTPLTVLNISNCPNLDTLICSFNDLTTLDISNNTALTYLECNNNNLSSLDIESNTALLDLRCGDNSLTALDVSNNILLTSIWCQNNSITELDFTNQTGLVSITVNDNSLTSLDIRNGNNTNVTNFVATGNTNLTCIQVDDASYSTTNWLGVDDTVNFTSTDYCRYTAIPDSNFEALLEAFGYDDISDDGQVPTALIEGVTSLTVNNQSISDFTGIEDFVGLTYLDAGNNNAGSINLTNIVSLEFVRLDAMSLISIDLSKNTVLKDLRCSYNSGMTSIDISNNSLLETAHISNNSIDNIDLRNNPLLYDLRLIGNDLTALDLTNNTALELLALNNNPLLTSLDLTTNTVLEELYASNCDLTAVNSINSTVLKEVYLDRNNLLSLDLSVSIASIEKLSVYENMLTDLDFSGAVSLEQLSARSNDLVSLDLSEAISLEVLYLSDNDLTFLNVKNGNNTAIHEFHTDGNASLECILVDDAALSSVRWTNIDNNASFNEVSCDVFVDITVFLQGAFTNPNTGEENLMRDDLRVADGVYGPTSPYGDGAIISESIGTDDAGSDSMVDWIWVELRDANDVSIVVAQQSGVLQRDGDIVATTDDRSTPLSFSVSPGNYYIVVKHRNHLSIMSSSSINLSSTATTVDLSSSSNAVSGGINAVVDMDNGIFAMTSGDFDENGQIQNSDINSVIQLLGGSGYHNADMDMNGQIQNTDINNLMNTNVGKGEQF